MTASDPPVSSERQAAGVINYLRIARVDHWFKNVFVLPGSAIAVILAGISVSDAILPTVIALIAVSLAASANYVINEWLDAETDKHHPLKKNRPGASGQLRTQWVIIEYLILAVVAILISLQLPVLFRIFLLIFLFMGLVYNVPPARTKDRAFLDVLSESVNNPLRLLLGWSALIPFALPPSSIIFAYWMGGAFLMAVKRFAEYRFIADPERAALYRQSFKHYTENSLLLSTFFYSLSASFFLGIFLIKYRIEFLISFPFLALLFAWYLAIGLKMDSEAQRPEKLYRNKSFVAYVLFLSLLITALFIVDIPVLQYFVDEVSFSG